MLKALGLPKGLKGRGQVRSKILFSQTILAKIYEANFSVSMKWRTTEKVQFQFLNSFLLGLTKFLI